MITRTLTRPRLRAALATAAAAAAIVALSMSAAPPASAAATTTESAAVHLTPALQERIQREVDAFLAKHDVPGVSVAVVTPDEAGTGPVITTFAAGVPTLGSPTPVDAATQFEIGSETKVFTADLLAHLVATGRVALDDPVQLYAPAGIVVPEWVDPDSGEKTAISLGDLATHRAGLTDAPPNLDAGCHDDPSCRNPRPGYTQTMLWDAFAQPCFDGTHCPITKPGTDWLYSDWGFGLLGTILSNVIDPVDESQPPAYQSALDQTFLDALGMSSTALETADDPRLATPYTAAGEKAFLWDNTNAYSGAGGLVSDATDLGTWVAAHLGYVSPDAPTGVLTMADTLQPVARIGIRCSAPGSCTPADFEMGLGWELYPAQDQDVGVPWAFKNGATEGSSSDTALAPSLGIGVTTLWNMHRPSADPDLHLAATLLALLVAERSAEGGGGTPPSGAPQPAALAESGYAASGLIVPGAVAATLLIVGSVLVVRRRRHA